MAQASTTAPDRVTSRVTGTFTAADQVSPWVEMGGPFLMAAGPTGAGSVRLEVSFDGGATAHVAGLPSGAPNLWTVPALQHVPNVISEAGLLFRLYCVTYGGTPIPYRMSR
ncbi:hypothetical protein [Roseococcus thiosulfatophilus]|uniref:hypothetical protein n=1 Tax=Roseococcus thiosulfatophilus TaxID=35813 RepID=UPI001A8C07FE|nr:hypothetical protein [Roseococcus thiosulfatophilus]